MAQKKMYFSPATETVRVKVESLLAVISQGKDDEEAGSRGSRSWSDED